MEWTALHGTLLGRAFGRLLGRPERGAMAFVRCLTPDVVAALAADATFAPEGWRVLRVADTEDGPGEPPTPTPRSSCARRRTTRRCC